jgi:integrase
MIEVLYQTGLRITELLSIKLEDCILINRKGKKSYREVKVKQKRNKEGTVFINDNLYKKVYKFFKSEKYLFEHEGKQYTRQFVSMEIKRMGAKIGRPEIHAHTIRHSFAMKLVNDKKLSIDQVQRAMNHSSSATTISFYLHNKPTPEDLGVI